MTNRPSLEIARNDIWLVNFDPTIGDEIQKTRPAVVSVRSPYRHKIRIVVPITSWQDRFANEFWMVKLPSTPLNGLERHSAANAFQVKSISEQRFIRKTGVLTDDQMDDICYCAVH